MGGSARVAAAHRRQQAHLGLRGGDASYIAAEVHRSLLAAGVHRSLRGLLRQCPCGHGVSFPPWGHGVREVRLRKFVQKCTSSNDSAI
jgi:hypothetical protein